MKKIVPCLWFDSEAEEAANFYASVFSDASVGRVTRYGKEGHEIHGKPEGSALTVEFDIGPVRFVALNGGPAFKFSEAVSFQVICETQEELDYYWERLSEGGDKEAQRCGWLKDRYGLSWQIVPEVLPEMLNDQDRRRSEGVMNALLQMTKLDIGALKQAYERAAP
ncbi:VOC family protein [Aquisalimonas sp.]|uniref:VOC family protein n=1 Tax=Aquisalimonas sp. TaxID=1872621 RepID=UPI0025C4CCE1|nr:VOC family protein [Aquisalimonas sp.]